MEKAEERVEKCQRNGRPSIKWLMHDLNGEKELPVKDSSVDAVISTLLVEHIVSLDRFFTTIYRILKKTRESWAFVSAMHPDMYKAGSQAAFSSERTKGEKFCGFSFDYSVEEIVEAANRSNLMVESSEEKTIESENPLEEFGVRAKKWLGVKIHLSFVFRLKLC